MCVHKQNWRERSTGQGVYHASRRTCYYEPKRKYCPQKHWVSSKLLVSVTADDSRV